MSTVSFNAYTALNTTRPTDNTQATGKAAADTNPIAEGVSDFRAAMQQAEKTTMETVVSGADPHAMVAALANAELMLDAAVTIRDKVVEAYQELLRMPV
ncbi:flagellar hook-basal body complex protein FliE [Hyphomonas johnsonii]|jgi:flagellar hook-basal body complex protein FliE|uniref:Flagellar hook-basal body complex protein FliE n=1 Tax=Hyphomonas johnsonii MHS-2 TaxID=1280950 RepID=A0A059FP45_9PROT|nr:flagellar hook-basal body complex protein FliE [Hyphomonas johnsonii]KCZ92238.1 flagellar hook-basal body complex protein FliE [Hyphomonas johnsonii MHS-2]